MDSVPIIISFITNILICFGIPLGYLLYVIKKRKNVKPFFIGSLVFLISQILLRIPLITYVLPKLDWYLSISVFNPILYSIFLGLTAGIFEEVGRYIGIKLGLKNQRTWEDGISFGMGHGGLEAMLITGIVNLQYLIWLLAYSKGTLDSIMISSKAQQLKAFFDTITTTGVLAAGFERIGAIIIHIGLTLIVLYGVKNRKKLCLPLAILIHGFIDTSIGVVQALRLNLMVFQGVFIISIIGLLGYIIISKKSFGEMYKNEENL
ncbi:putative membrane protein YhfC [Clostridium punense]|uniref:Membrane protein YhfC n=1 Tax=Clostridium punense TaxID=1054297 RepID=A0ABS4K7V9_9CLOT|nr:MULTISPECIES: YhfC family glutamic-type intramembrane protease [Clostridium]EQB86784.1 hypothetical protein M918_12560 [Clostridium sp. BL8]MBP2023876.1 putative membrane protein YhfC [Clostridium punense]